MNAFFLLIEISIPIFVIYLVFKKKDLSVVYLPLLFFSSAVVVKNFSSSVNYLIFTALILYLIAFNLNFVKRNIFAPILVIYFFLLIPKSDDLAIIRPNLFGSIWLFLLIPLIAEIFNKYSREQIFNELSKSALLTLIIFNINVILSTLLKFMPLGTGFYGATSGLMYGALSLDELNILPFAIFIVIRKGIKDKSLFYIVVYLAAIFFVLLTFRRTVMVLSVLATIIVLIELLNFKQIKDFILYGAIIGLVSILVIYKTGFLDSFWERYEMRKLDTRTVDKEPRLLEFEMIYKDMFVHFDYSPWFGHSLFNSHGNYGKGALGSRGLHTDFGTIMHGSGILGFMLYLSMVFVAFFLVWKRTYSRDDYLQLFFIMIAFAAYFMSGRWYTISAMTMMYCVLYLPLGKHRKAMRYKNTSIDSKKQKLLTH
jgi:O-antigen ligase